MFLKSKNSEVYDFLLGIKVCKVINFANFKFIALSGRYSCNKLGAYFMDSIKLV